MARKYTIIKIILSRQTHVYLNSTYKIPQNVTGSSQRKITKRNGEERQENHRKEGDPKVKRKVCLPAMRKPLFYEEQHYKTHAS